MERCHNTLVIRQKGESQNGGFKKTKHARFFGKRMCDYHGVRNDRFSENVVCFCNHHFKVRFFAF